MRHSCLFAAVPAIFLGLSGCGADSGGGPSYPNPATDVDLALRSFALENQSGLAPVLPRTIFRDLYRAIEPATDGADQGFADQLQSYLDTLMGLAPNAEGTDYVRARNPLDLMNEVITSGQVDSFNDGRALVRRALNNGDAANYNTPANDALIRFTETDPDGSTPPEDQAWLYPLLDWKSNPDINRIFRAFQFIATKPADPAATVPELKSAFWSARYAGNSFGTSGYNAPEYAATEITGQTTGSLELLQEFVGDQRDTLSLTKGTTGSPGITVNGQTPDCIRVDMDYQNQKVHVYASTGEPSTTTTDGKTTANPAYCGNQRSGDEALLYDATPVMARSQ